MATAAKAFTRALRSTPATSSLRTTAARTTRYALPQQSFRFQSRRGYASGAGPAGSGSKTLYWLFGLGAAAGVGGYVYSQYPELKQNSAGEGPKVFKPTKENYQKVYNEVAALLAEKDDYDDGSYGPVLVRLAWHASGTYDKETGTGGSNGATMRFAPEGGHGANAGLKNARDFLEPVKGIGLLLASVPSKRCRAQSFHGVLGALTATFLTAHLTDVSPMDPRDRIISAPSSTEWASMTVRLLLSLVLMPLAVAIPTGLASMGYVLPITLYPFSIANSCTFSHGISHQRS